jgi:GntR family transcriptional regulator of arabinose operon
MKSRPLSQVIAKANTAGAGKERARFRQIAESLRRAIVEGVYGGGDRLPTEMELAREHGVSRVTAAAALTELARAGLVTRTPRRGTVVCLGADLHRGPARPLVAWVVMHVETTFGLGLLRGIQLGARAAGFGLLLVNSGADHEEESRAIQEAAAAGAAGIMVFLRDGECYNAEVLRLVVGGYPVVLVDRWIRGVNCATVSSDNLSGSRMLVQELLDAGHRHICVLTYPPRDTSTIEDRIRGYVQALTDANVPVDYSLHYVVEYQEGETTAWEPAPEIVEAFVQFLRAHPHVTAIYATNAFVGLVGYRAVQRLGLRLPEDLSLVSIDPLEAIPLSLPAVTCGVQQGEAIGRTAVTLLQELMAGEPPRSVQLPVLLRRAGSVGPPAARGEALSALDSGRVDAAPAGAVSAAGVG